MPDDVARLVGAVRGPRRGADRDAAHDALGLVAARRVLGRAPEGAGAARRSPHHRVARRTGRPRSPCSASNPTASPPCRTAWTSSASSRGPASPAVAGQRSGAFLVDDPHGWTETGPPGTLAYTEADLDRLLGVDDDATVLLFVGRFLGFKRVPALIRAFARARAPVHATGLARDLGRASRRVGGRASRHGGRGGRDRRASTSPAGAATTTFPSGLAACDVLVVPSVDDPYPQVPLEAMAVGLPVVACASGGLLSMVNLDPDRPTGWFVPNDDLDALTAALVDGRERSRGDGSARRQCARARPGRALVGRPGHPVRSRVRPGGRLRCPTAARGRLSRGGEGTHE